MSTTTTRPSAEYRPTQAPPIYSSENARPGSRLASRCSSRSDSDSLVSAPSRPASPIPGQQESMSSSQLNHTTSSSGPEVPRYPLPPIIPQQERTNSPQRPRALPIPQAHGTRQSIDVASTRRPVPQAASSTTKIPVHRTLSRSHPVASINATNYACILRKTPFSRRFLPPFRDSSSASSIKGSFTIDPFLYIPPELLPPLNPKRMETEADRKNLRLEVENGGIDVDVNLVGEVTPRPGYSGQIPRTTIGLAIAGGSRDSSFPIAVRIHTPTVKRPPFHLAAKTANGQISVQLPRSFHGMLSVSVAVGNLNGHIALSFGMQEQATILSETSQARSYFVGRMGDWAHVGDKAELSVYGGKVSIQFDDEVVRRRGWGTLFG